MRETAPLFKLGITQNEEKINQIKDIDMPKIVLLNSSTSSHSESSNNSSPLEKQQRTPNGNETRQERLGVSPIRCSYGPVNELKKQIKAKLLSPFEQFIISSSSDSRK